ncbi:MAG: hypothetical protein UT32_C0040G0004 [Parcubacteria group bacterium GW2011_GWC2_39_14]|nr:MAG: hypothetical protein US92_C0014G0004 [Candidatus Peregrinibacteria bacterium GW2011_GWA2_38_36]KKR03843.1 MAG: hypothetical protein UT32_C0040G0004 [Parcubacteria group bacterium GW2011_GWC2_39_14]
MPQTLKNNAYHILGLDTSASERDTLKRSKEIINRLRVDDTLDYDLDIGVFENFRTEDAVKDALQRLQAPKKRIKEYFFWFQLADGVDEQVLGFLKLKDYLKAIRTWQNASEGQSTKAFFYKKNLAILYCLALSASDNKEYLQKSLETWKELVDSDKFWTSFSKVYKLHDEQTASEDIISDFKKHVVEYLSDIYTDLHHHHKHSDYLSEFQKVFSAKGERIEKSILGPAYQAISYAVEGLEKMEVSKDDVFDKEESEKIKSLVATVQQELNKLIDLGLYDDSQTKIMRDRAANALRTIVLDLHNNLSELQKSEGLLEVAIKLAGTESLKNKLQGELEQIQKNVKDDVENAVVIEIPGTFRSAPVVFKNTYVEYNKKRIFFKDATSYSFDSTATSHSVYGIPTGTSYVYNWSVISEKETISVSLTASKDESKAKEDWVKLVSLSAGIIEPFIVKKIVEQIFDRGETVKFGEVEFTKKGYSKIKFKFFKENEKLMVYWSDTIYIPKMHQGQVILWEDKNGESSQFASIPMSTPNAVILPALVQACYDRREK